MTRTTVTWITSVRAREMCVLLQNDRICPQFIFAQFIYIVHLFCEAPLICRGIAPFAVGRTGRTDRISMRTVLCGIGRSVTTQAVHGLFCGGHRKLVDYGHGRQFVCDDCRFNYVESPIEPDTPPGKPRLPPAKRRRSRRGSVALCATHQLHLYAFVCVLLIRACLYVFVYD